MKSLEQYVSNGGHVRIPYALREGLNERGVAQLSDLRNVDAFDDSPVDPNFVGFQVTPGMEPRVRDFYEIVHRPKKYEKLFSYIVDSYSEEQIETNNLELDSICMTLFHPQIDVQVQEDLSVGVFGWVPASMPSEHIVVDPEDSKAYAGYRHIHKERDAASRTTRNVLHKSSRPGRILRASTDLSRFNRLVSGIPLFLDCMAPKSPSFDSLGAGKCLFPTELHLRRPSSRPRLSC